MKSLQNVEKITWKTDVYPLPCNGRYCGNQAEFRVTVRENEVCRVTVCLCADCLELLSKAPNAFEFLTNTPPAPRGDAVLEGF